MKRPLLKRENLKQMSTQATPSFRPMSLAGNSSRGIALVLVLGFLVLITVLVIAFFTTVTTELSGAKSYASENSAKQLADSAAQVAIGAIRQATSGGSAVAWASQPGMIRTYDVNGLPAACFKLYSSDNMVVTSFPFDPATEFDAQWSSKPALFTDLNSPVASGASVAFPIIDGNAIKSLTKLPSGATVPSYLGYDANNDGLPDVEGFAIDPLKVNFAPAQPLSATNTPVPMPTKWIYVLKDGSLTTPTGVDATGKIANWVGSNRPPTASNPITGRIAFWTDDETCKVNINTASEGTYADTPRLGVESKDDSDLIYKQPVNHEYQSYPGHPGMTSLSVVFPSFTKDQIYNIIPRIGTGGSSGGTTQTVMLASDIPPPIISDSDRLYASVDELLFNPNRSTSLVDASTLQKTKFFLTANSRAPEVNLFGKPRISIWPEHVQDTSVYRTPYDSTIAFCSTMRTDLGNAKYRYYFQREDPTSSTHDLPPSGSVSGLGRNRMLLDYLKSLTSQTFPGFGASLAQKYSATDASNTLSGTTTERDQILTEIFDYVRSANLIDSTLALANSYAPGVANGTWRNGSGQVVPIEDTNGTRGFGRYRTVEGASLLFIGQVDGDDPSSQVDSTGAALPLAQKVPAGCIRIKVIFLPQLFDVAMGTTFDSPQITLNITGLEQFTWDGGAGATSMGFLSSIIPGAIKNQYMYEGAGYGDQLGFRQVIGSDVPKFAPSAYLDIDKTKQSFAFNGGDVKFEFTAAGNVIQTVVLRFPAGNFPVPKLADKAAADVDWQGNVNGIYNLRFFTFTGNTGTTLPTQGHGGRWEAARSTKPAEWVFKTDVIRSVTANTGDMRLIAARKEVKPGNSAYPFSKNAQYDNISAPYQGAHTLWGSDGYPFGNSTDQTWPFVGKLVAGQGVNSGVSSGVCFSDTPLNGVALGKKTSFSPGDIPGDWDTGVAEMRDGPFINKPDEGDRGKLNGALWPYKWKYHIGTRGLTPTLFSPNRQIPSAITFGSLPSGVLADKPWQTLLFRPGPTGHPGLGIPAGGKPPYTTVPDHLLLDLFWMPVVEPYPISEPFSTAGKVNMNYQIQPFTYINRDTGIRAILKSEKVISLLTSQSSTYKDNDIGSATPTPGLSRKAVDVDQTLTGFTNRFTAKDLFRSASEICDLDIIPVNYTGAKPYTRASMDTYWSTRLLTGDNCRERPYATIYPRLTTQSNTYTVHFRVQSLKKVSGTPANVWDETKDQVFSEYRGSQIIERYVDANDTTLPDFADPANSAYSLDSYPDSSGKMISAYKFRVLSSKKFTP